MRVITGEYGGRRLKSLPGDNTRPTTDKVKESIFNMIGPYFDGGIALDLYAGSGSLAIEAVSRGCNQGICVDRSGHAIKVIKENIAMTKETEKFMTIKNTANLALKEIARKGLILDYVFLDPPYADQVIEEELLLMVELGILASDAYIICETDKRADLPSEVPGYKLKKRQKYGSTEIVIYERSE
ncbi:16S rRNA (guanine(966)-N(2))-methyltransferase RsmD [Vagococcus salmoninarum]|uniref:16S rRNA (Guanine(966)-N(2))-methyltransferase RsmD n=1 Tax=Vagococcus salmoninarum TaxID=2739 RepID=A0A429ZT65_9ENTE|nr:16S rRNA (guanine(966)-N(2))-methyltransferase RsmD [Vagococcus salmoninarum]MBE9389786.1 16S rRNA (guanine(966)-N(2))-methyltransferase RsmD [Vagococcus salmoninarum]RST96878.1 16S rRNA (guanine(966)-N(2))-methyltransferase RsmD [Vagococcus salmoninarum]